ncbi:MAG: hypothetical protein AAF368_06710, partial [Planctomycetota bacterium]
MKKIVLASVTLLLLGLIGWLLLPDQRAWSTRQVPVQEESGAIEAEATRSLTPLDDLAEAERQLEGPIEEEIAEEEEEREEIELQAGLLTVRKAENREPLQGAEVQITTRDGNSSSGTTRENGQLLLPAARHWTCRVTAEGRAGRTVTLGLPDTEVEVALSLAGSLEVIATSEVGEAIEGAQFILVPPQKDGLPYPRSWRTWSFFAGSYARRPEKSDRAGSLTVQREYATTLEATAWTGTTDSSGRLLWEGLQPGAGYRVGWISMGRVRFDPPH